MTGRGQVNGRRLGGRPLCPINPRHGYLYTWREGTPIERWYCPHRDHDGWGNNPPTKKFFTDEDIRRAEGEAE